MRQFFEDIPLWLTNLLSIVGSVIAIGGFIYQVVSFVYLQAWPGWSLFLFIAFVASCLLIFWSKLKKYRLLSHNRLKNFSALLERCNKKFKDTFFKILHRYKKNQLTQENLIELTQTCATTILDELCNVLYDATGRAVSANVKVFLPTDTSEELTADNARITTFCRSSNSERERSDADVLNSSGYLLKNCTDFHEIIGDDHTTQKEHIYVKDLYAHKQRLLECGRTYQNGNPQWERFYKASIIVPIRMEYRNLYHYKRDDAYHIIGFLCVDSMYTDAFRADHEKFNCDIVRGVADILYILLSKYRHYSNKLIS